jgi:hypothetical protein
MQVTSNSQAMFQGTQGPDVDLTNGPVIARHGVGFRVVLPAHESGMPKHRIPHIATAVSTSPSDLGQSTAIPLDPKMYVAIQGPGGRGLVPGVFIPGQGFRLKQGDNLVKVTRQNVSPEAYKYVESLETSMKTPLTQTEYQNFIRTQLNKVKNTSALPSIDRPSLQQQLRSET